MPVTKADLEKTLAELKACSEYSSYLCNNLAETLRNRLLSEVTHLEVGSAAWDVNEVDIWATSRREAEAFLHPKLKAANLSTDGNWASHWPNPNEAPTREQFLIKLIEEMR